MGVMTASGGNANEPRYRYPRLAEATRRLLRTQGEVGRFEFKQTSEAVTSKVLVAAANAAALEGIDHVMILVGVGERQDRVTGVVTGEVVGLSNVEQAKQRITSAAVRTRPVPIGLTIIEENAETKKPILRLEVRPTRPPHFDDNGSRVTRLGASTRAVTDEELVELYLRREAEAFEARFRQTASRLEAELARVTGEVKAIEDRLSDTHELADQAAVASDEGREFVFGLEEMLGHVLSDVEDMRFPSSFEAAWWDLARSRRIGWRHFATRKTKAARAEAILREVLETRPSPFDYERNLAEAEAWYTLTSVAPEAKAGQWLERAETIAEAAARRRLAPSELEMIERQHIDPL